MKKFKLFVHYIYEYNSKNDAILHSEELLTNGLIFKKSYEKSKGIWVYEYDKVYEKVLS